MSALSDLNKYTYEVRHSPNCPSPFLIVTCGDGGRIGGHGNLFSYGKTLDEAALAALSAIDAHKNHRSNLARLRWVNEQMRLVRGVVWA